MYSHLLLLILIQNITFAFGGSGQECCLFYGVDDQKPFNNICMTKDKRIFTCPQPPYPKLRVEGCVPYKDNSIENSLTNDKPSTQMCDSVARIPDGENSDTFYINCGVIRTNAQGKPTLTKAFRCPNHGSVFKTLQSCKARPADKSSFDLDRYPIERVVVD